MKVLQNELNKKALIAYTITIMRLIL